MTSLRTLQKRIDRLEQAARPEQRPEYRLYFTGGDVRTVKLINGVEHPAPEWQLQLGTAPQSA